MSAATGARILVIEDDPSVRRVVSKNLSAHGFRVATAGAGREGLELDPTFHADLVLLDLGLPDMSGLEVITELRARTTTPVIVLSIRGSEADKVRALDLGADDYLTKPFGVSELLARVRVALRHAGRPTARADAVFESGDLRIDRERRIVEVAGSRVHLTPTEYALLTALASHPGAVLTERTLLQRVWGPEYGSENHYLHVYMARLRKKLELDPGRPRYIRTEAGVGYRLIEQESAGET
ncbi:MAG TPA: response regulator transcription factor [Candidatus Limnocylindria bacterium]